MLIAIVSHLALAVCVQVGTAPPPADGRAIVAAAVEALGGASRLAELDEWIVAGTGRENLTGELQGVEADRPTWRPHEETVAVVRAAGAVAWERRSARNDGSVRWRRFIHKPDAFGVIDWNTRRGSTSPQASSDVERAGLMRRVPHLLLAEVLSSATSIERELSRTIGAVSHDVVRATMGGGAVLTLVFGRRPVALRRAEYPVFVPGLGTVTVGWEWRDWHAAPLLGLVPSGHSVDVRGMPFQDVRYTRYAARTAEARRMMEVPADLGAGPTSTTIAGAGLPATGEVAPGIHVLNLRGFVVMLVEFRDFVVALEAPEAHPGLEAIPAVGQEAAGLVSSDYLAAIDRLFPSKPLRLLAVSHHHGDHIGGVRAFASRGVPIAAPPGAAAAIRALLAQPADSGRGLLGASLAAPSIRAISGRERITDGSRVLELIDVGANPHTAENLMAWLPAERIVFQGDLFYFGDGAPFPPSGRGTMNKFFAGWLAEHGISPRAIYGVHNRGAAGADALAASRR